MERLMSILRAVLTITGGFLIGRNLGEQVVNISTWEIWAGAIMSVAGVVWSVLNKVANIEMIEGAARQVIAIAGGFAVAKGWLTNEAFLGISGGIVALLSTLLGKTSTTKTQGLVSGDVKLQELKGADTPPKV